MIRKEAPANYGTYHLVNRGDVTWFDAALVMASFIGQAMHVHPINSDKFYTNLQRPLWTPLNPTKLEDTFQDNKNDTIPYLQDDLETYLKKIGLVHI